MRYKILVTVLVLALTTSLAFNVYHFGIQTQNRTVINNMRSRVVLVWAREMAISGALVENATTNFDMAQAFWIMETATETGEMFSEVMSHNPNSSKYLYWQMDWTPFLMGEALFHYAVGYPTDLKYINPTAFEMLENLAETIYSMTRLILRAEIDIYSGVDPTEQLAEHDVLSDIINYCINIQDLSQQIEDFSPKFQ